MSNINQTSKDHINSNFEETFEHLQKVKECLINLEERFADEDISHIIESTHFLNTNSTNFGFTNIATLITKIEKLFKFIQSKNLTIDRYMINLSFKTFHMVSAYMKLKQNDLSKEPPFEMISVINKLGKIIDAVEKNIEHTQIRNIDLDDGKNTELEQTAKYTYQIIIDFCSDIADLVPLNRYTLLNEISKVSKVLYSEPTVEDINNWLPGDNPTGCEFLISTNINDDEEMYKLLDISDVEHRKLINVTTGNVIDNEDRFSVHDINVFLEFFSGISRIGHIAFGRNYEQNFSEVLNPDFVKWMMNFHSNCIGKLKLHINSRKLKQLKDNFSSLIELLLVYSQYNVKGTNDIYALLQKIYIDVAKNMYNLVKNKLGFRNIRIKDSSNFRNLTWIINETEKHIFTNVVVDISDVETAEPQHMEDLIQALKTAEVQGLNVYLINNGINRKNIYNTFCAREELKNKLMFYSELEAIIGFNWGRNRRFFNFK